MPTATASIAERLGSTIFLAALAHGLVILGVTFSSEPFKAPADPPALNVTLLVDTGDDQAPPEHSEYLANRNELGGGQAADTHRPATVPAGRAPPRLADPTATDAADGAPRDAAADTDELLTRSASQRRVAAQPDATEKPSSVTMAAASSIQQNAPQTLAVELDDRASSAADGNRPDAPASPSASESPVAAYLVGWRQRVERIGTANFPSRFLGDGKAHGRPTLEVAIGADGRLQDIVVRKSSGDKRLDQAALKILRLAAPFDPLPPSILATHDVLRFAYEWDFTSGKDKLAAAAEDGSN